MYGILFTLQNIVAQKGFFFSLSAHFLLVSFPRLIVVFLIFLNTEFSYPYTHLGLLSTPCLFCPSEFTILVSQARQYKLISYLHCLYLDTACFHTASCVGTPRGKLAS